MIKLITHTDLDGVGCYILASYFYGKRAVNVEYVGYNNVDEVILSTIKEHENYDYIYITDISCSKEMANKLDEIKHKVKLLDHHKTALELNKYDWASVKLRDNFGSFEVNACGTQLFFMYLHDKFKISDKSHSIDNYESLIRFVEDVRRYDTWEWFNDKDEAPKNLNDLLRILGRDKFIKNIEDKLHNNSMDFTELDKVLLELNEEKKNNYFSKKKEQLLETDLSFEDTIYKVGLVLAEEHISELGNYLSTEFPDLDFIAIVTPTSISYRTIKDDIDLSLIAKQNGGGGHPKASGSPINKTIRDNFLVELLKGR